MSHLSIRLPNSLARKTKEWADRDRVSVDQFVAIAVAEKLAALSTVKLLDAKSKGATRAKFEAALDEVPDVEPAVRDRLPKTPATAKSPAAKKTGSRRK